MRSYRTVSPLPVRAEGPSSAVCSLLHFPSGRPDWPLASTLPYGAPTFLDTVPVRGQTRAAATRPAHRRGQSARAEHPVDRVSLVAESAGAQLLPLERTDAVSIAALYRKVHGALVGAFPRNQALWVRGEIQAISDRTGHCYIDLVDPDGPRDRPPVLKVRCWGRTWNPLKASLGRQGVTLEVGMVVVLRGAVDFYPAKAEVNFLLVEVDITALLGRRAAQRAALLAKLETEGLLRRNHALVVTDVPLRIGLVASPDTEGHRDFVGQLTSSGLAFVVVLAAAQVQGSGAVESVAAAIRAVSQAGCDVVVVVRGGGSRGDLSAFDAEPIARAIATAPVPVWTGIGHTGDQSVADIAANRSFITPTECGQELVQQVGAWWRSAAESADAAARLAVNAVERAGHLDSAARSRLVAATFRQLQHHAEHLRQRANAITTQSSGHVVEAASALQRRSVRIGACARTAVERDTERVLSWRRLLDAYDVNRQLERGYTITLGPGGRIVRAAAALQPGEVISTRFSDGSVQSVVGDSVPTAISTSAGAPAESESTLDTTPDSKEA